MLTVFLTLWKFTKPICLSAGFDAPHAPLVARIRAFALCALVTAGAAADALNALGALCGLIYALVRQSRKRVWAAIVAAVRVSSPQNVEAP